MILLFAPAPSNNALWHYCTARDWEDIHVVKSREELLRAVASGRVEIVLCSSLNGLGRITLELVRVLTEFVTRKVTLIIPSAGIDTSKVPGKVFLDTLDAISEFKHSAAVEAIHVGLAAAKARGVRLGRPVKVDGYREDVARLRAPGRTGRAIVKELGLPNGSVFELMKGRVW